MIVEIIEHYITWYPKEPKYKIFLCFYFSTDIILKIKNIVSGVKDQ
jgi:hypothetical protein